MGSDDVFFDGLFVDIGSGLRSGTNSALEWLIVTHGDTFEAGANAVLQVLLFIEQGLRGAHPALILAALFALALLASRKPVLSLGLTGILYLIGCLGLWEQAMQTVALMLVAVALAVLIGIPVGILMARSDVLRAVANPVLDLMQTIPSFVYLIPAAMLFGLGKVPAIFATVIYATPPLIRLTELGIRMVDREVVEASRSFGASRLQMLRGVQIPLALPTIMQGINQTMMMSLGMVVIASMIGARGIGETVLLGLQRNDSGQGLVGGLGIVILAILFDRISQAFGSRMQAHRRVAVG